MTLETTLALEVPDASPDERERGIAAATAIFDAAHVDPLQAYEALWKRERWHINGFPDGDAPTDDEVRAAIIWEEASEAAVSFCCAGKGSIPYEAHLDIRVLDMTPDEAD